MSATRLGARGGPDRARGCADEATGPTNRGGGRGEERLCAWAVFGVEVARFWALAWPWRLRPLADPA